METKLVHTNYDWNVIDDRTFKERVRMVFEQVSSALVKTLGPYGATTIIEKFGEMHITKDGWQVLKKIHFADSVNNNIMQLLIRISAQVVIKVGDGSTSSIVAANSILRELENDDYLKTIRPKELMTALNSCVEMITEKIMANSTKINKDADADYEEIYKLAMISTNGDDEVSRIIQTIYRETGNPSIEFIQSKTNKTSYEIVEGYKIPITYLDSIFANNDEGICNIEKPMIVMFDHKLDQETHLPIIQQIVQKAIATGRRLVVVAPHYDKMFLNYIASITNSEMRARGTTTMVFTKVMLLNNLSHEHFNDFSVLTGGSIIRENTVRDFHEKEGEINFDDFIGEVNSISIGDKTSMIKGFFKKNEDMYKIVMNDALAKYRRVEETHREMGIVNSELYDLKQRISKLKGLMGIINIGGNSSLEKLSNYDLVEDAVKACESAFNYGYNIGGNLIIPIIIKDILTNNVLFTPEERILELFDKAFKEVFKKVLTNKYTDKDNEYLDNIINICIDDEKCYDLITGRFSMNVINSCFTDIEILKAAVSIVGLLISSNQYISIMIKAQDE